MSKEESNNIDSFLKSNYKSDADHIGAIKNTNGTFQTIYASNPDDFNKELKKTEEPQPELKAVITIDKLEFETGETFTAHGRNSIGYPPDSWEWSAESPLEFGSATNDDEVTLKVNLSKQTNASLSLKIKKGDKESNALVTLKIKPKVPDEIEQLIPLGASADKEVSGKTALMTIDNNLESRWSAEKGTIKYPFKNKNIFKEIKVACFWGNKTYHLLINGEKYDVPEGRDNNELVKIVLKNHYESSEFVIKGEGNSVGGQYENDWTSIREIKFYGIKGEEVEPGPEPCEPGEIRDPITGKCVLIGEIDFPLRTEEPDFTIGSGGDGENNSVLTKLMNILKKHGISYFKHYGDVNYSTGAKSALDRIVTVLGNEFRQKGKITITKGNHDGSESEDERNAIDIAEFQRLELKSGQSGNDEDDWIFYYSIIQGNRYVIVQDAYDDEYDLKTGDQYQFVENALKEAAQLRAEGTIDWIEAGQHVPLYGRRAKRSPNRKARDIYHPLYEQYGVNLNEAGHSHNEQVTKSISYGGLDESPDIDGDD
ncbi:MAG: metallophosphoesterase, partial [Nitrososphaeraceae archaeon]